MMKKKQLRSWEVSLTPVYIKSRLTDFIAHIFAWPFFSEIRSTWTNTSRSQPVPHLDFQTMRQNVNESQRQGFFAFEFKLIDLLY